VFLINDLSMDGQFHDITSFREAVARVMAIRQRILQHGYSLYGHRLLCSAQVTPAMVMQQAVGSMPEGERRAWMGWLTRQGPYWEDARTHHRDEWLEVDGEPVTDHAVGEAALCIASRVERELVSFQPSSWLRDPIDVRWVRDNETYSDILVPNHWELASVEQTLDAKPRPVASWADVAARSVERCTRLTFGGDAFAPLWGQPFASGAAERIQALLNTLDRLKGCFNDDGTRTAEGHQLYQDHFTGDKAWFSDSSDTEKRAFADALTFRHPEYPNQTICCTWHGKVKTPQLRIHFSWPMTNSDPVYVVYVGPKLTKK
jgi:hypothetical protein